MKQLGLLVLLILLAVPTLAQSTNENFPSPVNANEVSGVIAARDIGDARLTRHFYTFFADNGDLNLTIETANFDGDVDLFEAGTLRPIAKITIAAGGEASKTSRIVYFRQREQVVLRVEGRTLVDDAARYRISFSGSFAAAAGLPQPPEDLEPTVERKLSDQAVARVSSSGAIIEVLPPKEPVKPVEEPSSEPVEETTTATTRPARTPRTRRTPTVTRRPIQPKPVETPETTDETATTAPKPRRTTRTATPRRTTTSRRTTAEPVEPKPDPLANVRLTVQLKNGDLIERPMSEVFRVSVDKGQLTVISKSGKIERFNLLEITKFSIEQ
jgi:hypothetical protein